jgi:phenylpropionate dioxygenase-like ring-hydroxylating dioxygenase large terminal subunit
MSKLDQRLPNAQEKPPFKSWTDHAREDRGTVSPHLFERGDDLGPAETFRVSTKNYLSREVHEHEVEHLWTKVWQWACRSNDISEVGDFVEYEIVGRSVIIVRDTPTTIKAFRNACRHRGRSLVSGCGHVAGFYCPYHGWKYGLDGRLQHIPAAWEFPHFDRTGLRPVQVDEFNGNVFINLDDNAPPLKDHLGETLMRHLSVYPDTRMHKTWHFGVVVESNWKVMAEAFFETYHIPATHPTIFLGAGDVQSQNDVFGLHHRLCAVALTRPVTVDVDPTEQEILDTILQASRGFVQIPGSDDAVPSLTLPPGMTAREFMADTARAEWKSKGLDLSHVSDAEMLDSIWYLVFPNFAHFVGPGGHIYYRFRPNGDDHTSMIYEIMNLTPVPGDGPMPPDAPMHMVARGQTLATDPVSLDKMGEPLALLIDEDVSNSAGVQKGMRVADEVVLGTSIEPNIVGFHRNLEKWVKDRAG